MVKTSSDGFPVVSCCLQEPSRASRGPGRAAMSEAMAVLCRTQRELMLLGFRREELLGESSLLLCCLGFFGFFFAAVWFKTD